jgi:hypothetical protein
VLANHAKPNSDILAEAVYSHIQAARDAARGEALNPRKRLHLIRYGPLRERAMSNLDAAEANLLKIAPPEYLLGQMPSLLRHIHCHLVPGDPRCEELQHIARRLGMEEPEVSQSQDIDKSRYRERKRIVEQERSQIVSAMRAASSASCASRFGSEASAAPSSPRRRS